MYPALGTKERGGESLRDRMETAPAGLLQRRRQQAHTSTMARQTEGPHHWHCVAGNKELGGSMLPAALPPSPRGQPAPLNPVLGQRRGEHNLGKAAATEVLCVY